MQPTEREHTHPQQPGQPCEAALVTSMMERIEANQLRLLEEGARHEQWLKSIDARLATLNGSVARHQQDIQVLQQSAAVEKAKSEAVERVKSEWGRHLRPVLVNGVKGLLFLLAALAFYHLRELKEAIKFVK